MRKVNVSVLYDEEKLSAIKLYMKQKDMDIKTELEKAVNVLYQKYVPNNVREFIDMRSSLAKSNKTIKSIDNQGGENSQ